MIAELLSLILMIVGAVFMLLAAFGVMRMPDVFLRMSATSKAATLGAMCVMVAGAIHFNDFAVTSRVVAIVVFLFLTAPVAAHKIARAAYLAGVPLWQGTINDDWRDRPEHAAQETSATTKAENGNR